MLKSISSYHHYEKLAGQTVNWLGTDTFDSWQNNMKDPDGRAQLIKYQFDRPESVSYTFNNHGFRCPDFDNTQGFIALGCSFTQGVGLPQDQIWPSIVQQHTGLTAWNLGVGACSMDTCFRLLYNWIKKLNANFVLLLAPNAARFEFFLNSQPSSFLPQTISHDVQKYWYSQDANSEVNTVKNYHAMKNLCEQHRIKFVVAPVDVIQNGVVQSDPKPTARDLQHVGHANHVICADYFLDQLN